MSVAPVKSLGARTKINSAMRKKIAIGIKNISLIFLLLSNRFNFTGEICLEQPSFPPYHLLLTAL